MPMFSNGNTNLSATTPIPQASKKGKSKVTPSPHPQGNNLKMFPQYDRWMKEAASLGGAKVIVDKEGKVFAPNWCL